MNTTSSRIKLVVSWALGMVLGLGLPTWTQAASDSAAKTSTKTSTKTSKKRKTVKAVPVVERTPSGETVADRERRLRRECKGRPNAGACAGFTH